MENFATVVNGKPSTLVSRLLDVPQNSGKHSNKEEYCYEIG